MTAERSEDERTLEPLEQKRRTISTKLTVLARQLWLDFDQSAEKVGVSRAKWRLIAAVSRRPGATQRTLATLLQVTDVTAGRLIDSLCEEGYLERHENPEDRRAYLVYLTPLAQPVLDQLGVIALAHERGAFAGFDEADLAMLESLLDRIARNVEESRKASACKPQQD